MAARRIGALPEWFAPSRFLLARWSRSRQKPNMPASYNENVAAMLALHRSGRGPGPTEKKAFLAAAKSAFAEIAAAMGLKKRDYEFRPGLDGSQGWGDLAFRTNRLWVLAKADVLQVPDRGLMVRATKSREDYVGGPAQMAECSGVRPPVRRRDGRPPQRDGSRLRPGLDEGGPALNLPPSSRPCEHPGTRFGPAWTLTKVRLANPLV